MFGDFQETHDDEVVDFEPFVEAVNSIEESNNDEWKGVFKDRSKAVESGVKFISAIGSAYGVSLGEGTPDENRGVKDVAGRLMNLCGQKQAKGVAITIILDNYSCVFR